jgi:hypothetical protein
MANATTWMTDTFSQLSGKTLQEIVFFGTHDTGMSECHGTAANVGALTASPRPRRSMFTTRSYLPASVTLTFALLITRPTLFRIKLQAETTSHIGHLLDLPPGADLWVNP